MIINRHVIHVFKKDGLEILRDRRTLFVNIVLPVLLYPLILLFGIQVLQLTKAQKVEQAGVILIDVPSEIATTLTTPAPKKSKDASSSVQPNALDEQPTEAVRIVQVNAEQAAAFREAARQLDDTTERQDETDVETREKSRRVRLETLALLRQQGAVAVLVRHKVSEDGSTARIVVLQDDASSRSDTAEAAINHQLIDYRLQLVRERLARSSVPESALHPLNITTVRLAPKAEAIRTRASGMLPLLLVLLAASGAFFPALDLIAGERERGTLESLLSWPVRRRDVFVGKLLVACSAAAASVILNIISLAVTLTVGGTQLAGAGGGGELVGAFSVTGGALALCLFILLPLTVTLAAVALAVTGLASSAKEAQNYLTPFFLVVMIAAGVAAIPGTRPGIALDLIPITGPVLALKESLQAPNLPWLHLILSTAASLALATVVIGWATRLLEDERFRYPGLVRAGWGRFRKWGQGPVTPGGLEVMGVFALAVGGFTLLAGYLKDVNAVAAVAVPLIAFTLLPALGHCWLGGYGPKETLRLRIPAARAFVGAAIAIPFAVMISLFISMVQSNFLPADDADEQVQRVIESIRSIGGLPLLIGVIAFLPGVCEELLCRGTLLSGLQRGIGVRGAIIVSAFLFAVLHLSPARFFPQFTLGIVLAVIALRTGSIFPSMIIHAGHNALIVVIELYGDYAANLPLVSTLIAYCKDHPILVAPALALLGICGLLAAIKVAGSSIKAFNQPVERQLAT